MQLSIIIVNFNVKYFLEQCLSSVIRSVKDIEAEILVIDNNSTDGSRDFFKNRFETVKFIWSEENTGFGKANNLALKQATGRYILFLNPDTILPEDCLQKCIRFFRDQHDIGAMGIRMIDGSGHFLKESKRGFPTPFTALCKFSGLTALLPDSGVFARYYLGHLDENKSHAVDVLAGAFMLVKKNVLDQTGGFDERFFMYGEDIDLSYRIQQAGFKNYYFSASTIIHFKGESTQKGSLTYVRSFYGAMGLFAKKHYSTGLAGFYNLVIGGAIGVKRIFTGMGAGAKPRVNTNNDTTESRCFIVSNKEEAALIKSILQKNQPGYLIAGQFDPPQTGESVQQLRDLLVQQNAQEIIFGINGFPASDMISLIQQLPAGINFRFHFEGTFSIVGSNNKKWAGKYIAVEDPAGRTNDG